jgi:hypothetical protein
MCDETPVYRTTQENKSEEKNKLRRGVVPKPLVGDYYSLFHYLPFANAIFPIQNHSTA